MIKDCKTTSKDKLCLFKVPVDAEVKKKWLNYVKCEGHKRTFDEEKLFHVCELHFLPEFIKTHDTDFIRARLVPKSYPSIRNNFEVS